MVEDVLIKVREFMFPVDFVVLETKVVMSLENEIWVMLGRPFLDTLNSLFKYKDREIKLTFEDMIIESNVYFFEKIRI